MNFYIATLILSILWANLAGWLIFKKYRNLSSLCFLWFTLLSSLWFISYTLFFSSIHNREVLLILTRLCFGVSIGVSYGLLGFIYFFGEKPRTFSYFKRCIPYIGGYTLLLGVYLGTPLIISGISYDTENQVYREILGPGILLHIGLHLLCGIGLIYSSYRQLQKQIYFNKKRLKYILIGTLFPLILLIFLQLILPLFGIWILEKETILIFPTFAIYIHYTMNRWYFPGEWYGFGKLFIVSSSILFGTFGVVLLRLLYKIDSGSSVVNYWAVSDVHRISDTLLWISLFIGSYFLLSRILLWHPHSLILSRELQKLQTEISKTRTLQDLNMKIKFGFNKIFKSKNGKIVLSPKNTEKSWLHVFFQLNKKERIFINDPVFIEEKLSKFLSSGTSIDIHESDFLIFPLSDHETDLSIIGTLHVGVRPLGEAYSKEEIEALQKFTFALELHLRYINTYEQLHDLSVHLDQKVDEKTFEYNQLINKQKEFINLISHEIKSPIANAIFQVDSIIDDIQDSSLTLSDVNRDLISVNKALISVGELTNKLFSVQYFDINSVSLFREKVQIEYMLQTEFDISSRMHESIQFLNQISNTIWFVAIDRIQIQQVLSNILGNAIKFVSPPTTKEKTILLEAYKSDHTLSIILEDSGPGFGESDPNTLFEKYTIGEIHGTGLGMGLYLCKKIVEMHNGKITASHSKRLWGAKICIQLPVD